MGKLHRLDGPAVKWEDHFEEWYQEGKLHREEGPAVIYSNGKEKWWIDDVNLTKEEWWEQLSDEQKLKALFNG
jgi:hypothetical protein